MNLYIFTVNISGGDMDAIILCKKAFARQVLHQRIAYNETETYQATT